MKARGIIAALVGLFTVVMAAFVLPGVASAHATSVSGTAECQSDGTWTVTWKIGNDYGTPADITYVSGTGGGSLSGLPATVAAVPQGQSWTYITATQTGIPGATASASLSVKATWSDFTQTKSGTVNFEQSCVGVTPATPGFTPATCTGAGSHSTASYTIPSTTGVKYYINGSNSAAAAQSYSLADGQSVTITAKAASEYYALKDYPANGWTYTATVPNCTENAVPTTPDFTDTSCSGPGSVVVASYTIPTVTGVDYYVNGVKKDAGNYTLAGGSSVTITAVAQSGYVLKDYPTGGWSYTATAKDCVVTKTPVAPTFTADSCTDQHTNNGASYTIPTTTGVDYYVGGVKTAAGNYSATAGSTVVVTAVAQSGYSLVEYPEGGWSKSFSAALDCTQHVTPATPTSVAQACTGPGTSTTATYTIPTTTGVDYYVGGVKTAAGTYNLASGASVAITAQPQATYSLDGTTSWNFTATPKDCTVTASPLPASFVGQQCTSTYTVVDATITVPTTTGVTYKVDGTTATGTVKVAIGDHKVTAVADSGYKLADSYPVAGWSYTVSAVPCEFSVLASVPVLASTGSGDQTMLYIAAGAMVAGLGLVLISRRRTS